MLGVEVGRFAPPMPVGVVARILALVDDMSLKQLLELERALAEREDVQVVRGHLWREKDQAGAAQTLERWHKSIVRASNAKVRMTGSEQEQAEANPTAADVPPSNAQRLQAYRSNGEIDDQTLSAWCTAWKIPRNRPFTDEEYAALFAAIDSGEIDKHMPQEKRHKLEPR